MSVQVHGMSAPPPGGGGGDDSGENGHVGEGVSGKSLHLVTFVVNLKLLF